MSKRAKKKKPSRDAASRETLSASSASRERDKPSVWLAAAVLALSIAAVYGPALDTPRIFDDQATIVDNDSIISLWPLIGPADQPGPLNPRNGLPTSARPLVNFSFAVNYYFGDINPIGYHVVNVVLHFISALLLWAIVRRTLQLPYFGDRFASWAGWLALAVALLWALHPLQTETVIYITQRTELMMGMFYLATLYCSLRYWETSFASNYTPAHPRDRRVWLSLAVLACLAGMGSKEVMVSAPLMVLLFERTFVAGSLGEALRRSWPLYVGLAATWSLLLFLSISNPHAAEAGFGLGPPIHSYWFTQAQVLLIYLKLVVWPWPLLLHYELPYLGTFGQAWMYVVPVVVLGLTTLILLWRNNPIGYLGTWCFAILAPTSVIPIILEMAAERRMYLPLAALIVLFVVGGYYLVQWALRRRSPERTATFGPESSRALVALSALWIALTLALGLLSAQRLRDYEDEKSMWREVLHYQPQNPMALSTLGILLIHAGNLPEALENLRTAVELRPKDVNSLNNLGLVLTNIGRPVEAISVLQRAAELKPEGVATLNLLGIALADTGRTTEALEKLEQVVRLKPNFADARNNLGHALINAGRYSEAIDQLNATLALRPDDPTVHSNLSRAYRQMGNNAAAIEHAERALQLRPIFGLAHENLGAALLASGDPSRALKHFRRAVEINPHNLNARQNLGRLLAQNGDADGAVVQIEQAIRIARSTGQVANAQELEQWLTDYRAELKRRGGDSDLAPPVQPTQ